MLPESSRRPEVEPIHYPTLATLGEQYHYQPTPENTPIVDLGIEWDKAPLPAIHKAIDSFNTTLSNPPKHSEHSAFLFIGTIPTTNPEPISLAIRKYIEFDLMNQVTRAFLKVDTNSTTQSATSRHVSTLEFKYTATDSTEDWNLTHREVAARYRNQGIASHLLAIAEQGIAARAESTQKSQTVTVNIGQASVLLFFLKRGYTPRHPEDAKKLQRFLEGDPELIITSSPPLNFDQTIKNWYIFEKAKLPEPHTQAHKQLWFKSNSDNMPHYTQDSFRIELEKKLA